MNPQDQFDRVLASLYEATLDDTHWPRTSKLIDEACGSVGNNLIIYRGDSLADFEWLFASLHYRGEMNEEINRIYPENYLAIDERVPRLLRMPDGNIVHVPEIYTDRELKSSATYNELLVRARGQQGLNIRMDGGLDGSQIMFVFADPVEPNGWSSDQVGMVRRLLPHIRQLVRVRQTLVGAQALGASLAALLGNRMVGVVCLDRRGAMVETNARALEILRRGDGLHDRNGFLHAQSAADDARLGKLLARVLPASGEAAGGTMTIARSSPHRLRLALHATPLAFPQLDFGVRVPSVLVLIVDPTSRPSVPPRLAEATLGLTPSESQVAALLAEGRSIAQIAAVTRRQKSSVRWLLKHTYAKLDISRQSDLVRMVLSMSGFGEPGK